MQVVEVSYFAVTTRLLLLRPT